MPEPGSTPTPGSSTPAASRRGAIRRTIPALVGVSLHEPGDSLTLSEGPNYDAFSWTQAAGMVDLGPLNNFSEAE